MATRRPPSAAASLAPDPQAAALAELSRWMDAKFHIPGTRLTFGFDALIGLIPGAGDFVTSLVSLYILVAASRYPISRITMARMAVNIGVDFLLGSIPLVGDMFDLWWKANVRNVRLLHRSLEPNPHPRKRAAADWAFVGLMLALLVLTLFGAAVVTLLLVRWLWEQLQTLM